MAEPLTPREREVAGLVAKGLPNKQIAAQLKIDEKTVEFHLRNAARRLGGRGSPRHLLVVYVLTVAEENP